MAVEISKVLTQMLYKEYRQLAISMFDYEGLPETVDPLQLEEYLFDKGSAVFFNDPKIGFQVLPNAGEMKLNIHGKPTAWRAVGMNGYNKAYHEDNSVLIKGNYDRSPLTQIILFYINRLVDIELTIQTNQNQLKLPFVFSGEEKEVLSFKNMFKRIVQNDPVIYKDGGVSSMPFQVHQTGVQYFGGDLMDLNNYYEGKLYTLLGINNINIDKKERLVTDEVNANNEQMEFNAEKRLEVREQACKRINDLFNLNISVKLKATEEAKETVLNEEQNDTDKDDDNEGVE